MHAAVDYFGNMSRIMGARCFFCTNANPYQVAVAFLGDMTEPLVICAACWQAMHAAVLEAEDHYLQHPPRPPQTTPWILLEALANRHLPEQEVQAASPLPRFSDPDQQTVEMPRTARPVANYSVASRPLTGNGNDRGELPGFLADRKPRQAPKGRCAFCDEPPGEVVTHVECANGHVLAVDYRKRNCAECGAQVQRTIVPGCPEHGPYHLMMV